MKQGGRILCSVAVVAVAACSAQPELQIRPMAASYSMQQRPVPIRIAEARAQFALGNVALALESFRKASREDPSSTDALAGMAACYDRMARFDLSRRYYEMALAIAPGDTQLLAALAGSMEQQGAREEAAAVRQEIALRIAAAQVAGAPAPATEPVELASLPAAAPAPAQAVAALPPTVVPTAAPARPALARPLPLPGPATQLGAVRAIEPAAVPQRSQVRVAGLPAAALAQTEPAMAAPAVRPALQPLPEPAVGQSVTIDLPPPSPAETVLAHATDIPAPAPQPAPVQQAVTLPVQELASDAREETGPRVERLSMGEVALVTTQRPRWEAKTVARTDRSTTLRFVPLREANARQSRVRVLNAARVDRLAARTRSWLTARGWSRMPIGDAPAARADSVVVYPAGQRALAQSLANQFGFAMEERSDVKFVTMLLGRDAARIEELQPRRA